MRTGNFVDQQLFSKLYRRASDIRRSAQANRDLDPWFRSLPNYPPVLGFGLPTIEQRVAVITIGLNPSVEEFVGSLPTDDDPVIQHEAQSHYFEKCPYKWFGPASDFLKEATAGEIDYAGDRRAMHLDLLPLATHPFDCVYDKQANVAQRIAAVTVVRKSVEQILLPLLLSVNQPSLRLVLFGFRPNIQGGADKGSRTMKAVLGGDRLFCLEKSDDEGPVSLGYGRLCAGHPLLKGGPQLRKLPIVFSSRGPSNRTASRHLPDAGRRIRALGWL
jgi:hypothetical protein